MYNVEVVKKTRKFSSIQPIFVFIVDHDNLQEFAPEV